MKQRVNTNYLGYPNSAGTGNPGPVPPPTAEAILAYFHGWNLSGTMRSYLAYHAERYQFLMAQAHRAGARRILDIGPSFQTALLRAAYPEMVVDSFGFEDTRFPARPRDTHIAYDLNCSPHPATWPKAPALYDLVVMAEVIEHLYTAARPVLACVGSYLLPGGCLILQTPNAVSLGRRTAMLRGKNPYSMIREERINPDHFCEFTASELRTAVESAGLEVRKIYETNYFGEPGPKRALYNVLCRVLPGGLRDGLTLLAFRPGEPGLDLSSGAPCRAGSPP